MTTRNGRKRAPNKPAGAQMRPRPAPRRRRRANNRNNAAVIGINQSIPRINNPTGGRRETGSDLLSALTISKDVTPGDLIFDVVVTPNIASRLGVLASAWQRMKYDKLMFGVNASASSLTGGEFVAAFIADPTDKPPLHGADRWIKAHQGSVTSSWWRSINVHGPCPPQVMYTSFVMSEPRFSSPGRFVIAVVNAPTSDATMSVSLDWHVKFDQPSLEYDAELDQVFVLNEDCRLHLSDGGAGISFQPQLRKGLDTIAGKSDLSPEDFTPVLPPQTYLRLPFPKSLNSDTGASGAPENAIVTHIGVNPNNPKQVAYFYTTDDIEFIMLQADKPFSIAPVSDTINKAGTIFEEDVLQTGLNLIGGHERRRVPRSLTSAAPQLKSLPSGKQLSFQDQRRF